MESHCVISYGRVRVYRSFLILQKLNRNICKLSTSCQVVHRCRASRRNLVAWSIISDNIAEWFTIRAASFAIPTSRIFWTEDEYVPRILPPLGFHIIIFFYPENSCVSHLYCKKKNRIHDCSSANISREREKSALVTFSWPTYKVLYWSLLVRHVRQSICSFAPRRYQPPYISFGLSFLPT